jgi:1,4-alpha-glucan branching enzyme
MKILQVTPEYPPYNLGGGGVLVQNLSKALSKKGCDLTVAAGYYPVRGFLDKPFKSRDDNFVVEWLPLWPTIKLGFQLKTILPPNIRAFIKMLKIFLEHDFDVVHIHGFGHGICDLASILCEITHKPYLLTSHGLPKEPERAGGILRILYQAYFTTLGTKLIERAKQVVAVSKTGEKEIKQWFPQKNTVIIKNAVELQGYFPISQSKLQKLLAKYNLVEKKIILCVGRLSIAKGFKYAIHALPIVINKIPNAHLLIIGKDDGYGYFNKLMDAVNQEEMEEHVTFLGKVTDAEKKSFFGAASVVLIPSIVEVFGIVALEALAARKPIVASRVGGLAEILSATSSSILVEPRNAPQLSNALIAVLSKKEIYNEADTNRLVDLDQFDPRIMVNSYVNLYKEIIHNHYS